MITKDTQKIKNLFNEIAIYYDKMNNIISFGTHYIIKFLALRTLNLAPRTMLLDLCCGTGDNSRLLNKFFPRVKVIGLDFSANMVKIAKLKNPSSVFMQGDCTNLPFGENEFDYITISFGLRNIPDKDLALNQMYRVLKRGGKVMHLDVGNHNFAFKIFTFLIPIFAKIFRKSLDNYNYLKDSVNEFLEPEELVKLFETHNFKHIKTTNYLLGAIASEVFEKM